MGGGGGDWVYTAERMHYANTREKRWSGGYWASAFKDLKKAMWMQGKIEGILPRIPEGVNEAICFDEDLIQEDDGETLYICTYSCGVWNTGVPFAGRPQPYKGKHD